MATSSRSNISVCLPTWHLKSADLYITVETRDHEQVSEIMAALAAAGFNAEVL